MLKNNIKKIFTLTSLAIVTSLSLAACGGGAQGGSSSPNSLLPSGPSTSSTATAKASISFNVPKANPGNNIGTSSVTTQSLRQLLEISPATDKFALMIDGNEVVQDVEVANYNNAGPSTNGTFTDTNGNSVQISFAQISSYFTVNALITTTPGKHTFGVVLKSGSPAYVLSEAQATYSLVPTFAGQATQALGALSLKPAVESGYIECANWDQNTGAPAGSCANGANFSNGVYTFTAVAADYDGFPIVNQIVDQTSTPPTSLPFDNGSVTVVETDPNNIVSLSNNGPFSSPGIALDGPSSSWVPGIHFKYGNAFNAACRKVGTATLGLKFNQGSGLEHGATPIDGYNYTFFNDYAPVAQKGDSTLPLGGQTTVKVPQYNVTVNCTAAAGLSLQ